MKNAKKKPFKDTINRRITAILALTRQEISPMQVPQFLQIYHSVVTASGKDSCKSVTDSNHTNFQSISRTRSLEDPLNRDQLKTRSSIKLTFPEPTDSTVRETIKALFANSYRDTCR